MEVITAVRNVGCPGVELFDIRSARREWGHLNQVFSLGLMTDWYGQLHYQRRQLTIYPGDTFLLDPGELFHAAPLDERDGAFRVLEISADVFIEHCQLEGARGVRFREALTKSPPPLSSALVSMHAALMREAEPLELQSLLAVLVHAAVSSVLEETPRSSRRPAPLGPCERLRDLLHSSEGSRINLHDFARRAEVSQFQLIRAFKRRYGSPPHAYGLYVRVARARELLRRGFSVAEAAAATDFTDQSHLTRHFRRIHHVTPGRYAAGGTSALDYR
jgi:AraC-like DNA-binding protein